MSASEYKDSLLKRYDQAIRVAHEWLEVEGRSQSWLARQMGVERSVLSRFLNREADAYTPDASRPRMLQILEGIERICVSGPRDIFLSHRGVDKKFVRKLAADIESHSHEARRLVTWVDEAEIRPGQSIPGLINQGLETSRFIGLVLTKAYFESEWTEAEWHATLYGDPDNKRTKLIPLLVEDCPYIPMLLRHLRMIDFRGTKYESGLEQLLRVLRDEPLPRPLPLRGQLIEPSGFISRAALLAERAVPEADPDVCSEKLYSNLLPVERLPQYLYKAKIAQKHRTLKTGDALSLPTKQQAITIVRAAQEESGVQPPITPAFRLLKDNIVSFHDLEDPDGLLSVLVEQDTAEVIPTTDLTMTDEGRKLVISLLNMSLQRHLQGRGLQIDNTQPSRFFFPPKDGRAYTIKWRPMRNVATWTVAKAYERNGKCLGWVHQAADIRAIFFASQWFVKIRPTRLLTEDGYRVKGGPDVGRVVIRWLGQERNIHVLYHVRFWTLMLRRWPGPTITVKVGDQFMEIRPVPAFVQQAYGLKHDRMEILRWLDEEAQLIADQEERDDALLITTEQEEADDLLLGDVGEEAEEELDIELTDTESI
jgi:TIR domain